MVHLFKCWRNILVMSYKEGNLRKTTYNKGKIILVKKIEDKTVPNDSVQLKSTGSFK